MDKKFIPTIVVCFGILFLLAFTFSLAALLDFQVGFHGVLHHLDSFWATKSYPGIFDL